MSVAFLAGNTGAGVYHEWPEQKVLLDVKAIPALHIISCSQVGPSDGTAAGGGRKLLLCAQPCSLPSSGLSTEAPHEMSVKHSETGA